MGRGTPGPGLLYGLRRPHRRVARSAPPLTLGRLARLADRIRIAREEGDGVSDIDFFLSFENARASVYQRQDELILDFEREVAHLGRLFTDPASAPARGQLECLAERGAGSLSIAAFCCPSTSAQEMLALAPARAWKAHGEDCEDNRSEERLLADLGYERPLVDLLEQGQAGGLLGQAFPSGHVLYVAAPLAVVLRHTSKS